MFVADDLATAREYAIGPQSPYRHYYRSIVTKMKKSGRAGLFKADPNASDDSVTLDGVLDEVQSLGDGTIVGPTGLPEEREAGSGGETDEFYDQAVRIVTESRRASISGVQRRLKIGYNRAARLIEEMEAAGIVSAPQHNGNREVLAPPPPKD